VVADAIGVDEVLGVVRESGGELLESARLFDVYRGPGIPPGTRSLAFALRFCALDRTLTDTEVGALRTAVVDAASRSLGATLRA
jgi:phenylalanyl-tRNA synthetase beta chain